MSRTKEQTVTLTCPLDSCEQDFAATMMQMTGISSEANLVRLGLWHLARHLDVPIGRDAFGQRKTRYRRTRRSQFGGGKNRLHARQLKLKEIA